MPVAYAVFLRFVSLIRVVLLLITRVFRFNRRGIELDAIVTFVYDIWVSREIPNRS